MIRGLILGFQFLTRLPINIEVDFNSKNISKSIFFYPLIGATLGFISFIVYSIFIKTSRDLASLSTVISMIVLTGGLHLDGLCDTFDGFYSNKNKEKTLSIMGESTVGAFGVIILILAILSKYIIISNIDYKYKLGPALILSMANSRLVLGNRMSYGRSAKDSGLGYMFNQSRPRIYSNISCIVYIGFLFILKPFYLIPLCFNMLLAILITRVSYKKIDGFTGDVYGALVELGEIVSLLVFLEVFKWI